MDQPATKFSASVGIRGQLVRFVPAGDVSMLHARSEAEKILLPGEEVFDSFPTSILSLREQSAKR